MASGLVGNGRHCFVLFVLELLVLGTGILKMDNKLEIEVIAISNCTLDTFSIVNSAK